MSVHVTPVKPMAVAYEPWPGPMPTPLAVSPEIIAYHQPEHAVSKEYATLLQTLRAGLKNGNGVLLLAGLKPGAGTSTVLLNLAVLAATQKLRVMLIDGHTQRPDLAQRLGQAASSGFMDVLDGATALEQAIQKTEIGALHLLSTGASNKMQRPLTADAMSWLIALLRERYDLILMDGPTAEDTGGLAVHLPHADGVYLVLPRGANAAGHEAVAQPLRRMGGRLCGLIHTHFDV